MPIEVPNREEWFPIHDSFPSPDWPAINDWMRDSIAGEHRNEAATQITRHWLARLLTAIGAPCALSESEHYILLSKRTENQRKATLEQLEKGRKLMMPILGDAAKSIGPRPQIFIELDSSDALYAYLPTFDSEGTHEDAARLFFAPGAIPTPRLDLDGVASLAHPLVDHLLHHFSLPRWLRCGAAGYFNMLLVRGDFAKVEEEWIAGHRDYWNAETIQYFWSGRAFTDEALDGFPDNLAEVLVDIMTRELKLNAEKFAEFMVHAEERDAGAGAAFKYLNVSLGDVVSAFLGDGDWSPKPSTWR